MQKQRSVAAQMAEPTSTDKAREGSNEKKVKSMKGRTLSRVFSEDYEKVKTHVNLMFKPNGKTISLWSQIYLVACLVSLFVDPLFLLLPRVRQEVCVDNGDKAFETTLTIIRTFTDVFYVIQIFARFRTAYVAPSSRVFGRGEFVVNPSKVASRYLNRGFWLDLIAALPLPQVLIWIVIPYLNVSTASSMNSLLHTVVLVQYIPRIILIYPLKSKIVETTGAAENAVAAAAYNFVLYMLASNVTGALWYLQSVERHKACWRSACNLEKQPLCELGFLDCRSLGDTKRMKWLKSSNVSTICRGSFKGAGGFYQFGIYGDAAKTNLTSSPFLNRYVYSYWWGLRNLSTLGQGIFPSIYLGELLFVIVIVTIGLVLFCSLLANVQKYLQTTTTRLEEWRNKKIETEEWMHYRQLPTELRRAIRKFNRYQWVATGGVDEEAILEDLPPDLRREIKRHLCLNLVTRVPLFQELDETTIDAICERLKPMLGIKGMILVREGDPVHQMLFIIRGHLESYTIGGGGSVGFYDSCKIVPGDFCGEELLTWALDSKPRVALPSSTRTVKAISKVEAFTLLAEDLTFVASQYKLLHTKQLKHKLRFHSHQWRTWAACSIQAAWRRYKKLKESTSRSNNGGFSQEAFEEESRLFWEHYNASMTARSRSGTRGGSGQAAGPNPDAMDS